MVSGAGALCSQGGDHGASSTAALNAVCMKQSLAGGFWPITTCAQCSHMAPASLRLPSGRRGSARVARPTLTFVTTCRRTRMRSWTRRALATRTTKKRRTTRKMRTRRARPTVRTRMARTWTRARSRWRPARTAPRAPPRWWPRRACRRGPGFFWGALGQAVANQPSMPQRQREPSGAGPPGPSLSPTRSPASGGS